MSCPLAIFARYGFRSVGFAPTYSQRATHCARRCPCYLAAQLVVLWQSLRAMSCALWVFALFQPFWGERYIHSWYVIKHNKQVWSKLSSLRTNTRSQVYYYSRSITHDSAENVRFQKYFLSHGRQTKTTNIWSTSTVYNNGEVQIKLGARR